MDFDALLAALANDPTTEVDAAELALWLARDEYPDIDIPEYLELLNELANSARKRLTGRLEDQVARLSHFLFDELKFRGNTLDYYDPENSFLNRVLDRRVGLPITLSILTAEVGNRAGLSISGVGLPGHFLVMARDGRDTVLFDPFHGGRALKPMDAEALVKKVTGEPFSLTADWLEPVTPGRLMKRMLSNLKSVYLRQEDFPRAIRSILRLRQLDPGDIVEKRDLAICLIHVGRPGPAVDLLAEYLSELPAGVEAEQADRLLRRARAEVARWN